MRIPSRYSSACVDCQRSSEGGAQRTYDYRRSEFHACQLDVERRSDSRAAIRQKFRSRCRRNTLEVSVCPLMVGREVQQLFVLMLSFA